MANYVVPEFNFKPEDVSRTRALFRGEGVGNAGNFKPHLKNVGSKNKSGYISSKSRADQVNASQQRIYEQRTVRRSSNSVSQRATKGAYLRNISTASVSNPIDINANIKARQIAAGKRIDAAVNAPLSDYSKGEIDFFNSLARKRKIADISSASLNRNYGDSAYLDPFFDSELYGKPPTMSKRSIIEGTTKASRDSIGGFGVSKRLNFDPLSSMPNAANMVAPTGMSSGLLMSGSSSVSIDELGLPEVDSIRRKATANVLDDRFGDLFYTKGNNVSKDYTTKKLNLIVNELRESGAIFPGELEIDLVNKDLWKNRHGRKSLFYKIKSYAFGGDTYIGDTYKNGKLVKGSRIPVKLDGSSFVLPETDSAYNIIKEQALLDSGIAYREPTGYGSSGDVNISEQRKTSFESSRAIELKTNNDFTRSVKTSKKKSKALTRMVRRRQAVYSDFLETIKGPHRKAIELDTLIRFNAEKSLRMSVASADDRLAAKIVDDFVAGGKDYSSFELQKELEKVSARVSTNKQLSKNILFDESQWGKGSILTIPNVPASDESYINIAKDYLDKSEYLTPDPKRKGEFTDKFLSRKKIKGNIRKKVSRILAGDDVIYGSIKSSRGVLSAELRGMGEGVASAADVTSRLKGLDWLYANNPEFSVQSGKGGIAGNFTKEGLSNRVDSLHRAVTEASLPVGTPEISQDEIRSMITSNSGPGLEAVQAKENRENLVDDLIRERKKGRFLGKETSARLTKINEVFKSSGNESAALKKFRGMKYASFDLETTGLFGEQFGANRDFVTQFGASTGDGKGTQFLTNTFPDGGAPSAVRSRYEGLSGARNVTGIELDDVLGKGLRGKGLASKIENTISGKMLLSYNGSQFDDKLLRGMMPLESMGVRSLDVKEMAEDLLPRKSLKLYNTRVNGERAFSKLYQAGNIGLNLGTISEEFVTGGNLHGALSDATLNKDNYEKLLAYAERRQELGLPGESGQSVDRWMPSTQMSTQRRAHRIGIGVAKDISKLGIESGVLGSSELLYQIRENALNEMSGGRQLIESLQAEAAEGFERGRSSFEMQVPSLNKGKYTLPRRTLDASLSIERSFATEYGERLMDIRLANDAGSNMSKFMRSAKKNWKGVAIAGAALTVGMYAMNKWKANARTPLGEDAGENANASLYGGTSGNTAYPETMQENTGGPYAEQVVPTSYAARVHDPNSIATNIRVRAGSSSDMNYDAFASAMGSVASNRLGAGAANVRVNVSDDRRKMNQQDISRKIARMM